MTSVPPPDELAARFVSGTLAKAEWTHEAHLVVGLWHIARHPPGAALDLLRARIRRLNELHGTPNSETRGYHETITRAYVQLLSAFSSATQPGSHMDEKAAQLLCSPMAAKDHLLLFYSRDRLMSVSARMGWIEPDLQPLPCAGGPGVDVARHPPDRSSRCPPSDTPTMP